MSAPAENFEAGSQNIATTSPPSASGTVEFSAAQRRARPTKELFDESLSQWRKETGAASLAQQKYYHPTYLKIIGLGEKAIPFLLAEVERGNRYLFVALEAITGENPARTAATLEQARGAWVAWGARLHLT